ncbi:unnamed protein product [Brassicogethes aeneus]|uniref:Serine/threonine-protein phosphatase PGAM5, mitochondrial n=1 Tax=Brassicogethes aeneus TaxID=1431903 RepID=A0A9P0AXI6_BRAAE|nr:unnamed protein product [Brassicogethes aeneus]
MILDVPISHCDLLREGAPVPPEPPIGRWKPELHQYYQDGSRIEAAFRKYFHRANVSQEKDSFTLLVCHANVIRYFACRALQFPAEGWLRISLNHASITWITITPSAFLLSYFVAFFIFNATLTIRDIKQQRIGEIMPRAVRKRMPENEVQITPSNNKTPKIITEKPANRPLVTAEGKILYQCHFCAKMFAIEIVRDNHSDICPKRGDIISEVDNNNAPAKKIRLVKQKENKTPPKLNDEVVSKDVSPANDGYVLNQENHVSTNNKIIINNSITVKPLGTSEDIPSKVIVDDVDKSLKCRMCAQVFLNPFEKLKHTRETHKIIKITVPYDEVAKYFDNEDKDNCPICAKHIKSRNFKSVFVKHLLTHTQGTIYPCPICYRRFRRKDHMKNHERRHAENGEEITDSDQDGK